MEDYPPTGTKVKEYFTLVMYEGPAGTVKFGGGWGQEKSPKAQGILGS